MMMMMMIVMINNIGDEGAFDWDFSTKSFSCTLLFCLINIYVVNFVFVGFLKIQSPNPFPSVCSSSTSHPSCDNLTDSCLSLVSGEQNTFKMLQLNFSISFLCLSVRSLSQYLIRQIMEIPQGRSPLPGRSLCPGRHGGGGQGEGRRAEVGFLRFLSNFQL